MCFGFNNNEEDAFFVVEMNETKTNRYLKAINIQERWACEGERRNDRERENRNGTERECDTE